MTKKEKILWLQQHTPEAYLQAQAKAEAELDRHTPIFCFCGALASGWHTSRCKKFQERLKTKIIQEIGSLLPK